MLLKVQLTRTEHVGFQRGACSKGLHGGDDLAGCYRYPFELDNRFSYMAEVKSKSCQTEQNCLIVQIETSEGMCKTIDGSVNVM